MPTLQEGQLKFNFPVATTAVRFDDQSVHGLSHCMKAVDFIVEFKTYYLFVEVNDPDDTNATQTRRSRFAAELALPDFTRKLTLKYRDSFLYRWAEEKLDKPVRYVVLLALSTLQPASYLSIDQALKRDLPTVGVPQTWRRPIVDGSAVLSLNAWNDLGIYGSVRRV